LAACHSCQATIFGGQVFYLSDPLWTVLSPCFLHLGTFVVRVDKLGSEDHSSCSCPCSPHATCACYRKKEGGGVRKSGLLSMIHARTHQIRMCVHMRTTFMYRVSLPLSCFFLGNLLFCMVLPSLLVPTPFVGHVMDVWVLRVSLQIGVRSKL
jgi:hypothetical protein